MISTVTIHDSGTISHWVIYSALSTLKTDTYKSNYDIRMHKVKYSKLILDTSNLIDDTLIRRLRNRNLNKSSCHLCPNYIASFT